MDLLVFELCAWCFSMLRESVPFLCTKHTQKYTHAHPNHHHCVLHTTDMNISEFIGTIRQHKQLQINCLTPHSSPIIIYTPAPGPYPPLQGPSLPASQ